LSRVGSNYSSVKCFFVFATFRDSGAITSVRTQGECGACWAVTAVETVEAAHFLATGTLYELSESEIIACDDSCQMCDGKYFVLAECLQDDSFSH
jgi:C1A family cysteine protease